MLFTQAQLQSNFPVVATSGYGGAVTAEANCLASIKFLDLLARDLQCDPIQVKQVVTTQFDPFFLANAEFYSVDGSSTPATATYTVGGTGWASGVTLSGTVTSPFGVVTPFSYVTTAGDANISGSATGLAAAISATVMGTATSGVGPTSVAGSGLPWLTTATTGAVVHLYVNVNVFAGTLGNAAALSVGYSSNAGMTLTRSGANFASGADGVGKPAVTTTGTTARYYAIVAKYQLVVTGSSGSNAIYSMPGKGVELSRGANTIAIATGVAMTGVANIPTTGATVAFNPIFKTERTSRFGALCGYIEVSNSAATLGTGSYVTFTMPSASAVTTGAIASGAVGGLAFDVIAVNASGVPLYEVAHDVPTGYACQDNGNNGLNGQTGLAMASNSYFTPANIPNRVEVCVGPTSGVLVFNWPGTFGDASPLPVGAAWPFNTNFTPSST